LRRSNNIIGLQTLGAVKFGRDRFDPGLIIEPAPHHEFNLKYAKEKKKKGTRRDNQAKAFNSSFFHYRVTIIKNLHAIEENYAPSQRLRISKEYRTRSDLGTSYVASLPSYIQPR